jgi:hypothetical protein
MVEAVSHGIRVSQRCLLIDVVIATTLRACGALVWQITLNPTYCLFLFQPDSAMVITIVVSSFFLSEVLMFHFFF